MRIDYMSKAKNKHKDQTGNKNKNLNKIKLGNVKHELFEYVMKVNKKISSSLSKEIIVKALEKEKINEKTKYFKQYKDNLILFLINAITFKVKYLINKTPIEYKSNKKLIKGLIGR
jgi:hypothetical protein